MVVAAFPAAKLGSILLKQISKPLANYIKYQAKNSPVFRKYVCMPPGQFYNWCEVKTKMWVLNLGKPINIPVLNEAMAIELGANLLGEFIIFTVAAGALLIEYNRSVRKEAAKEKAKEDEIQALSIELQELFFELEEQKVQVKELLRIIGDLDTQVIKKPSFLASKKSDEDKSDEPPSPPSAVAESSTPSRTFAATKTFQRGSSESNTLTIDSADSLLLSAVKIVESEFFDNPNAVREAGIITVALNHIYKNVYQLPLAMY